MRTRILCLKVSLNPVQIFKAGADEEKAETARLVCFVLKYFDVYIFVYFLCIYSKYSMHLEHLKIIKPLPWSFYQPIL
jgi:hypothetical protein